MHTKGHVYLIKEVGAHRDAITKALDTTDHAVHTLPNPSEFLKLKRFKTPAVILIGVRMYKFCAAELQLALKSFGPTIPTVIVDDDCNHQDVIDCFKLGVIDFLLFPFVDAQLTSCVQSAIEANIRHVDNLSEFKSAQERFNKLTPREKDICNLMGSGLKTLQIARSLGIAEATVKIHKARVYKKLSFSSVVEIARLADLLAQVDDL